MPNLALTLPDRGVHGHHRADHGAEREQQRHHHPEAGDQTRGALRLLVRVVGFAHRTGAEPGSASTAARNASNAPSDASRTRTLETTLAWPKVLRTRSRSAQISDAYAEPASSNTPTISIGRFARARCVGRARAPRSGRGSPGPRSPRSCRARRTSLDDLHRGPEAHPPSGTPRIWTLAGSLPSLSSTITTISSPEAAALPPSCARRRPRSRLSRRAPRRSCSPSRRRRRG